MLATPRDRLGLWPDGTVVDGDRGPPGFRDVRVCVRAHGVRCGDVGGADGAIGCAGGAGQLPRTPDGGCRT